MTLARSAIASTLILLALAALTYLGVPQSITVPILLILTLPAVALPLVFFGGHSTAGAIGAVVMGWLWLTGLIFFGGRILSMLVRFHKSRSATRD